MSKIFRTEQEWRELLGDNAFRICRQKGTERAFTGEYWDCKKEGDYLCRACGQRLFASAAKYDSGSGWPSYFQPVAPGAVESHADGSLGMERVEVRCSSCGSHLGHVFTDGPPPTGLRYCINSAALTLKEGGPESGK